MIIDGRQPGDRFADEHEETLDDVSWRVHDLGQSTGPDYQTLASSGDSIKDGIDAVRAGIRRHLLAFREYQEIESVQFTSAELADIQQTRLEAYEADEVNLRSGTTLFPGE